MGIQSISMTPRRNQVVDYIPFILEDKGILSPVNEDGPTLIESFGFEVIDIVEQQTYLLIFRLN